MEPWLVCSCNYHQISQQDGFPQRPLFLLQRCRSAKRILTSQKEDILTWQSKQYLLAHLRYLTLPSKLLDFFGDGIQPDIPVLLCFKNPVFSSGRRNGREYRILARFTIFNLKAKWTCLGGFGREISLFESVYVALCAKYQLFFDILIFVHFAFVGFKQIIEVQRGTYAAGD